MISRIDRHWLNATFFTLALVGLVTTAIGTDLAFALAALVACAVGFGVFYLMFAGGWHFGITVANCLACYACAFEFFREANFRDVPQPIAIAGLGLPVVVFLVACVSARRRISTAIHARREADMLHPPPLSRWMPGLVGIGAASFALPTLQADATLQSAWLLVSMAAIGAFVAWGVRDVVVLMADIAQVFEGVAARLGAIFTPMLAFLTYYSLLVVVFTCLYRIADMATGATQFRIDGRPASLSFSDAFHFSLETIATVGYGDIIPVGALARALAAVQIVLGVMLLLFGFAEIMRAQRRRRDTEQR